MASFSFILVASIIHLSFNNLICNGDFENYELNQLFNNDRYTEINSDLNCWYNKHGGVIRVKRKPPTTKAAQLQLSFASYVLCQKAYLVKGQQYKMKYSLYCPPNLYYMSLKVKINGLQVSTLYLKNQGTFGQNQFNFTANSPQNQICFEETHSANIFYFYKHWTGGFVDNITLIQLITPQPQTTQTTEIDLVTEQKQVSTTVTNETQYAEKPPQIQTKMPNSTENLNYPNQPVSINSTNNFDQNQTQIQQFDQAFPSQYTNINNTSQFINSIFIERPKIVIHFTTVVEQLGWKVQLIGDIKYEQWLKQCLKQTMEIRIEGQIQKDCEFSSNQDNLLIVNIQIYRAYDVSKIDLIIDNQLLIKALPKIEVYVDGKKVYFSILTDSQKKVIQDLEPIAEILPKIIQQLSAIISASLCSYFVLSLFNFWNLSLMYNFLIINTVPNFARSMNQMMISLLYLKGSMTDWIVKLFKLSPNTFSFDGLEGVQAIEQYHKGFSWFGLFGFSSIAIKNNIDISFGCLLLIAKILLLKIILRCFSGKTKEILGVGNNFMAIFFLQIIAFTPFIMISSFFNLVESVETHQSLRQKFIQSMLLFICLIILPIWYLSSWSGNLPEMIEQKQQLKYFFLVCRSKKKLSLISSKLRTISAQIKSEKVLINYTLLELFLNLSIPGLIWLDSIEAFLLLNGLIICYRIVYFCKNASHLEKIDRIFGSIITLVWFFHHSIYFIFYVLSLLKSWEIGDQEIIQKIRVMCGIITLLTVLIGGTTQILRFISELILYLILVIKKIKKACTKKNKVMPMDDEIDDINQQNSQRVQDNSDKQEISPKGIEYENESSLFYQPTKYLIKILVKPQNNENTKTKKTKTQKKINIDLLKVIY